jgi:outer membrane protein OmpA-like peptidoglycan-associated protein
LKKLTCSIFLFSFDPKIYVIMKLFYVTLALFSVQMLFGQLSEERLSKLLSEGSLKELVDANTELMVQGSHYHAMLIASKMVDMEPDNANFNYRKGRSMLSLGEAPSKALPYFIKGASLTSRIYNSASHEEKNAPNDAFYWLAKCYHLEQDLDNAEVNYQKYLDIEVHIKVELRKYAQNGLQQVANARREAAAPRNYMVKNAGSQINGLNPDFASFVALDGSAIYFTSRRLWPNEANADVKDRNMNQHWESIFMSLKEGENWSTPTLLDFCTPENNYASVSVSKDERIIYTYNDNSGNGDIYMSNLVDGDFKTLEKVMIPRINTSDWEPHFVMSPDGNSIFFVSNRSGGYGGRDIWKLVKQSNGEWSRDPINLGAEINSEFDEDSPFLALDGKTLFYATNGPKSTGGFDIMKTRVNADGSFTSPENMGFPLNSTHDDIFFTTIGSGETGYFTSYRKGGFGEKDIYEVHMVTEKVEQVAMLRGVIKTQDGSTIPNDISAKLICSNCAEGEVESLPRMRDGVLLAPLEKGKNYELVYMQSGNELHKDKFSTSNDDKFQQIDLLYIIGVGPVVKNYFIDGTVVDSKTGKPVEGATVELITLSGAGVNQTFTTNADGKFVGKVLDGYNYGTEVTATFTVKKDGYIVQTEDKSFKLGTEEAIGLNFSFVPEKEEVVINDPIGLKPIYYDLDKSNIRDDAEVELNKIIRLMNENPDMVIELTSHTDCRHTAAYNQALSQRRAVSAVNYIKKGLKTNPGRITGKGMGETQPVNNCKCECEQSAQEVGMKKFRECEDEQAKNCSDDQHQANRRTEFRIVKSGAATKSAGPAKK